MPLRCLDPSGRSIHSFDLSDDEWKALELENRKTRHLRMPCCSSHVTLKRSRLGTPFFAHRAVGSCTTAPETEEHLHLKQMVVMAARAHGWTAQTEATDITPSGEPWRADVLATRGKHRVAVEIQWSGQTNDETMRRQERYKASGVRGLWLLRQPGFPVTRDLPAMCIGGSLEQGFQALIPSHPYMHTRDRNNPDRWHQIVPMEELLNAAFSRRLRFGRPRSEAEEAAGPDTGPDTFNYTVIVSTGVTECWHRSCGARTRIVTLLDIYPSDFIDTDDLRFTVFSLDPEILRFVVDQLPRDLEIGQIKPRFSKTVNESYMSNGCFWCDRIVGRHFEHAAWGIDDTKHTFPIRLSRERLKALRRSRGYADKDPTPPEAWIVEPVDTSST
jgi:hypothetical protein